jgi:hypothetical protein
MPPTETTGEQGPRRSTRYEGNDMIGHMLKSGNFPDLALARHGAIVSMTNVRDTALIITEYAVFRARPEWETGYCIELVSHL